jgi:uncharacterized protein YbbC (DUF1343 family)
MQLGIDILLAEHRDLLKGQRVGVLAHAASVNARGAHTVDRLARDGDVRVTALFGPEHGIATAAQDMEAVASVHDPRSGIPIYSLYGNTLESLMPTQEMLDRIDVLVVDLQDIGSRYYTYVWTAVLAMQAAAAAGKKVIICDRPNPIGGDLVEGAEIQTGFESFVGLHSIPVRHGMTIGEIVQWMNDREGIGADLTVIPMKGWQRGMSWNDTGLPWTNPSPNMRSYSAALLYPGMCLVEATNISEGRGTDTPFEIVGAPYFDSEEFIAAFEALGLPGVHAAPTSFIPMRQKWAQSMCHGVRWVVSDAQAFRPYATGLAFLWLAHKLYRDHGFEWRTAPYEFVTEKPAIDLLTGSGSFRESIDDLNLAVLWELVTTPEEMLKARERALMYSTHQL